jgi:predicted transcriptional regulator of viral defense system
VAARSTAPDWDQLFITAAAQEGFFTTQQAADAGYSAQLLVHHVKSGSVERVRRGIYRLKHYVPAQHEELVIAWLWSDQQGVLSHETAMDLHALADVLPHRVHLTLPSAWRKRRFREATARRRRSSRVSRRPSFDCTRSKLTSPKSCTPTPCPVRSQTRA